MKAKLFLITIMIFFTSNNLNANYEKLAYDFSFKDIDGSILKLSDFKNKIILVVNVASKCGFTNQYEDLQVLWEKYKSKGLVVLGVPSNEFGNQEPGTNEEIKTFCESKFGISFPMTEKVFVKGSNVHPFYSWAKRNFGKSAVPKWNFHKIIIDKNGKIAETFSSLTKPTSKKIINLIEDLI